MYDEEQLSQYIDDLKNLELNDSVIKYIEKNKNTKNFDALVEHCCCVFLDEIQRMFHKYDKDFEEYKSKQPKESNLVKLLIKAVELTEDDKLPYYRAAAEFFKGNKRCC